MFFENVFLLSGTTRCFRLPLYLLYPNPEITHFFEEPRFLLVGNVQHFQVRGFSDPLGCVTHWAKVLGTANCLADEFWIK